MRPTKAAALALRARLWVYAASPLFNGGYREALSLTNKDGKRLFPDRDDNKWQTAKKHLEALLRFAESHGMDLYYSEDRDPHTSIYELFQYYNDEILWANGNNDYNDGVTLKMEARTIPGDIPSGMGNVGFIRISSTCSLRTAGWILVKTRIIMKMDSLIGQMFVIRLNMLTSTSLICT